jgi:hypothetical protein
MSGSAGISLNRHNSRSNPYDYDYNQPTSRQTTSMSDDKAAELKGAYHPTTLFTRRSLICFAFSARLAARDAHVRESWVRAMEARIVRDQLQSCYRAEGVNHYETCRELSEKYITLLRENRVRLQFLASGSLMSLTSIL